MKTFSAGLAAAYASGATTICACLKVVRTDDVVELFTSLDRDVTVGGETYIAATGLDISNLVVQSNLAVDNMELTVLPDETTYPQVDILAGLWDNAKFWLFECDYTDATLAGGSNGVGEASRDDVNLLKRGTTGEADTLRSTRKFEFRALKQAYQQPVGRVTMKTCPYRLGSTAMPFGLCKVDLSSTDGWVNTYAITTVTSRHVIAASSATEDDDFYGEGIAKPLTGANAGQLPKKIKSFSAGVFTLSLEFPFTVLVGDTFEFTAGCRKRLLEDCRDKFDNVLNFGGEPHVPGADLLTADPVIDV